MPYHRTIIMRATPATAHKYDPTGSNILEKIPASASEGGTDCVVAKFLVTPEQCKSPLGAWLARRVASTDNNTVHGRLLYVTPETVAGALLGELAEFLRRKHDVRQHEWDRTLQSIRTRIDTIAARVSAYADNGSMFMPAPKTFAWPVFGEPLDNGFSFRAATNPESYFDQCAGLLRSARAVLLGVGPEQRRPPPSVMQATYGSGKRWQAVKKLVKDAARAA